MMLLEIKLMLLPLALLVIAPVWVIPVLDPAAELVAVTVIFPDGDADEYPVPLKTTFAAP